MKVLITGVNGFVGKYLYQELAPHHEVVGFYHSGENLFPNCYKVDLANDKMVQQTMNSTGLDSVDTIVHLASKKALKDNLYDLEVLETNVRMAKNLSLVAKKLKTKNLINLSSSSIYPNIDGTFDENSLPDPSRNTDCIYGLSKYNSEIIFNYLLQDSKIILTHLRSASVYGKGMHQSRLIPVLLREIEEKNSVTLFGNGKRIINRVKVENLVKYISQFIVNPYRGVINLKDEHISVLDLAHGLIREKGNKDTKIKLIEKGSKDQFILSTAKLDALTKNFN